jgi:hypothetical protein
MRASGEQLGLRLLELRVGQLPAVVEFGELGKLVDLARACASGRLEALERYSLRPILFLMFVQSVTTNEQVCEHADEREDDDEEDPERLGRVREVMAAEDVEHDTDRDPDPQKQDREL